MEDTCCYFWERTLQRLLSESETKQDPPGGVRIGTRMSINAGDTVRSLVRQDSTCCGAAKPTRRNLSTCPRARAPQREKPLQQARPLQLQSSPTRTTREGLGAALKTQHNQRRTKTTMQNGGLVAAI